ncbi:PA0069 family radical SAM protein [uncultured Hyphomonas sp.]|jgi:DNA repair photolyase|uniref:PA0069 family radical SAM protein n=1 Tax=uncultured Hyphomonas sp. TaxID=225298 RepID=UPI000C350D7F|nr:radical SAM protein [Hyphomonadaceae bacterium]MBA28772.1 radical SAM protein [Hyphomonadaceae bacterium]|tara:strand:- start:36916 stop:38049 length:1134 start_codon:yes stop_codon:yes gene_type:complete
MRTGQKLSPSGRVNLIDARQAEERFQQRGRGAVSNQTGRFESETRYAFDDGWGTIEDDAGRLETTLLKDTARTIITFNKSPDISFDRTVNPYRGCEHGCIYCFARPTHAWGGLSAGLDFESKLFFKDNAVELLKRELSKPSYLPRVIALGMNTDAYQPVEREMRLTRSLLEVLSAYRHPVSLLTKSALIQRDIDLIAPMAEAGLARVGISLTTLDRTLARKMEPRAATPQRRLDTIRALSEAGIEVTVMTAPIIPGLNDHEIESLLDAAADHGATRAGYVMLRLPYEIKDLFHEWLVQHVPDRAARIINHIRDMRGGKDYDANWHERMRGGGPVADLISRRFGRATARLGMNQRRDPLRTNLFRVIEEQNGQFRLDV